ncbi:MAG: hypothetical protein RBG13Loki_0965 [Promethearchaeota archaeon CR_4]|nr:MAG: hypothetical protein RBG13Loki_0965 [Candidatus Lokiarchaeota archaeon CR_4]
MHPVMFAELLADFAENPCVDPGHLLPLGVLFLEILPLLFLGQVTYDHREVRVECSLHPETEELDVLGELVVNRDLLQLPANILREGHVGMHVRYEHLLRFALPRFASGGDQRPCQEGSQTYRGV